MSRFAVALTVGMTLWRPFQTHQTYPTYAVQVIASQGIVGALPFAIPSLGLKGDVRPAFGNRLHVVTIAVGEEGIEAEVRRFVLVTTTYWPDPIGISVYATEIAEHLAASGHRVKVLTSLPHYPQWRIDPQYRGRLRRTERRNGVDITRLWLYVPRRQSTVSQRTS